MNGKILYKIQNGLLLSLHSVLPHFNHPACFPVVSPSGQSQTRRNAELGGFGGIDVVADGDNGIQIVEIECTGNLPLAFLLNCSNFLSS
ncbi:hypothetical protein [Thiothrix caldifontis]|uniref:hypothetical protein n=1 Tax=Thiothrix caldifontis TaxID=525918 RepID=UPI003183A110